MIAPKRLYKVVLTGGPCAGKTTAKALILERFSSELNVVCLPELASLTFKSGIKIDPSTYSFEELVLFTKEFVAMQIKMEDYFEQLSRNSPGSTLLVCDRGACDTFGYCSLEVRARVLQELGLTFHELSSNRYDMVLHLVSCANGAPQFYNTDNEARFETVEEAVECDKRIQAVWMGHPSFSIINNSHTGFMEKMNKVLSAVGHFIGKPEQKLVKKFLLGKFITLSDIPPELHANFYREKVVYLKTEDENRYDFITCKKSNDDMNGYYFFKTRYLSDKEINRVELSRRISKEMFNNFLAQRDPSIGVIRRIVYTFVSQHANKNTEFHRIESYQLDNRRFSLLRVDCESDVEKLAKESFLQNLEIVRDVTGELTRGTGLFHSQHRQEPGPPAPPQHLRPRPARSQTQPLPEWLRGRLKVAMGTPSNNNGAALSLLLPLALCLAAPVFAQSVARFDLTVSLPNSIPSTFAAVSSQMFAVGGVGMQQLFSLSGSTANTFQVAIPAGAGRTSVNVSSACVGPLALLTDTATLSATVAPKSFGASIVDLLNFNRNLSSRTLDVQSFQTDFASQFSFNKAQYLSWDTPAFLWVFCSSLAAGPPPSLSILADDALLATSFVYPNPFAVIDRDITFKIAADRNQTISVPPLSDTVYFNFNYTGEDGLLFDIAGTREQLVPGTLLTAKLPESNPLTLSISNPRPTSALVRMRTSLNYSLPGWKIALIVVFSVVGGLALIVGALFIYVSYKRSKKEAEYPVPLDNVVDLNELQKRDTPTTPSPLEIKGNSGANDFSYKPLQIQGNVEYPPLPEESGSGSNQPILARSIELDPPRQ